MDHRGIYSYRIGIYIKVGIIPVGIWFPKSYYDEKERGGVRWQTPPFGSCLMTFFLYIK